MLPPDEGRALPVTAGTVAAGAVVTDAVATGAVLVAVAAAGALSAQAWAQATSVPPMRSRADTRPARC
ncbi:hypothetical protein HFRIS_007434 [Herbaspirillum frisingense GSF30]|uniref:Uncharacterized protein n=1 Tax=Herbaspirillum frisingense GSF30 TaxID=864073 RepID=A0AAI9IGI1_9BURK|nr:hypothetical protein HFRIS_007434 [Herbaspirillum frisingense GSF30]